MARLVAAPAVVVDLAVVAVVARAAVEVDRVPVVDVAAPVAALVAALVVRPDVAVALEAKVDRARAVMVVAVMVAVVRRRIVSRAIWSRT